MVLLPRPTPLTLLMPPAFDKESANGRLAVAIRTLTFVLATART